MELPVILKNCPCGRVHKETAAEVMKGSGALLYLPEAVRTLGGTKAFVVTDKNTFAAAGERVTEVLADAGIEYTLYVFQSGELKPDGETVGTLLMHFDETCDTVVGVGSGVINDSCKVLSKKAGKKYILVATAPSMDGFVSNTSSMDLDGLKVSLPTKSADIVIGDTDVLRNAPERMLVSGLGDMIAKYISICDWRISAVINGEYYCENVAGLIRESVKKCVGNADALIRREPEAVEAVFDGLVLAGAAMNYAGASRPASGVEHYFSHVWDMRALEFGTACDFHGIQCAVGTLMAAEMYDKIKKITPDASKAEKNCSKFEYGKWSEKLREFLGSAAEPMIELEAKENKYSEEKRRSRTETIIEKWPEILGIIDEEVPHPDEIRALLEKIGAPTLATEIGIEKDTLPMTFLATKDIRDKYVLSRLVFDLGLADEFAAELNLTRNYK